MLRFIHWAGAFLFAVALPGAAFGGPVATDNASEGAYSGGEWVNGSNGGNGFTPWVFGVSTSRDRIGLASATSNGGRGGIDTEGLSFFLLDADDSKEYVDVFRTIPGGLRVGAIIHADLAVNFRAGFKGLRVLGADDQPVFRVEAGSLNGVDAYAVHDADGGTLDLGWEYHADTVLHVELEQTRPDGGLWRVTRGGRLSGMSEGTFTGTVKTLQFYTYQAGSDRENALFFNNLQVGGHSSEGAR